MDPNAGESNNNDQNDFGLAEDGPDNMPQMNDMQGELND
jgi:hypothetical protein